MIILLILLVLAIIGIWLANKYNSSDFVIISGVSVASIAICYLAVHITLWSVSSYRYNKFVIKRNAFETTLHDSRINANEYESATILKNIIQWNIDLASHKYNNNVFLLKDYVDDRIETLSPIK